MKVFGVLLSPFHFAFEGFRKIFLIFITPVEIMSLQRENGQWGESIALEFLQKQGMEIITTNWRHRNAEIDIIARENGILVFVEVKMRSYTEYGQPEEMVRRHKRRLLIDAGMAYMRSIQYEWEIRFDVVAIVGGPGRSPRIRLFRDAFFPGLNYRR